jgi:hypothetical protein
VTWPLGASLFFTLLSLAAFCVYGFNMVLIYLFALSAAASFMFWRESSPGARGRDGREGKPE